MANEECPKFFQIDFADQSLKVNLIQASAVFLYVLRKFVSGKDQYERG